MIFIEQIDKTKAECGKQEAVDRMQHRIPERIFDIEAGDLAQHLGAENEAQDGDFQRSRQLDAELFLHKARCKKQDQRQDACEKALPLMRVRTADSNADDKNAQDHPDDKCRTVFPNLSDQLAEGRIFMLFHLPILLVTVLLYAAFSKKLQQRIP